MNPKATKNINLFATIIFSIAGLACTGLAAYMTVKPAPAKQAQYVKHRMDKTGCLKVAQELGFNIQKTEGSLSTLYSTDLDSSPKELVDKASLVIASCKAPMERFCMGEGCPTPGLTFILNFAEPMPVVK